MITSPDTSPADVLRAIVAAGVAAYQNSLPDYARGPVADTEPTAPNITIADDRQRVLCLSCPLGTAWTSPTAVVPFVLNSAACGATGDDHDHP